MTITAPSIGLLPREDGAADGALAASDRRTTAPSLRLRLVVLDGAALAVAWSAVLWFAATPDPGAGVGGYVAVVAVTVVASLLLASAQHLYLARVCATRCIELALVGRVALASAVIGFWMADVVGVGFSVGAAGAAALGVFVLVSGARGAFAAWLRGCRSSGRYVRDVVILGANDEAFELWELLTAQPDLGYRVVGVIGAPSDHAQRDWPVPCLGGPDSAAEVLAAQGVTGAILAVSAFSGDVRVALTHDLLERGVHVQVSAGIAHITQRRLRPAPIGREPLYYLEPCAPSSAQVAVKRLLDLVVGGLVALVTLPIVLIAAAAIRIESKGSPIFRQVRLGRDGKPFVLYKLRTMVEDADERRCDLQAQNERNGPLFKLHRDPRVTRVGRFLRLSSIDELPQLWCVLRGTMSLVGPRPALAEEVEQFDIELRERLTVRPGITGLWQVEARDNPSFHAYRRLDLFYLENWSLGLDLAILAATAESVVVHAVVQLRPRERREAPSGAPVLALESADRIAG